jgi:hypothetical protein
MAIDKYTPACNFGEQLIPTNKGEARMIRSAIVIRSAVLLLALAVLGACAAGPQLPKPTVMILEPEVKYYVDNISVGAAKEIKSETIVGHVEKALRTVNTEVPTVGVPLNMNVTITKLHDVGGFESLMIGGSNSIDVKVELSRLQDAGKVFEIDLHSKSSNYAPGGIIGMMAEAGSEDEPKLAVAITTMIRQWVVVERKLAVKQGAI